jgi:hypothetical protein
MSIIPSAAPNNTNPVPLSPEREQEIRELTAGVQHFTAPWHVDYEMTDGYWPVSYSTDNPLAGLMARVPDYGVNAAFFIAESATFVPELLAELDRLRNRVVDLEGAAVCPSQITTSLGTSECAMSVRHRGDHRNAAKNHYWSDDYADNRRRMAAETTEAAS